MKNTRFSLPIVVLVVAAVVAVIASSSGAKKHVQALSAAPAVSLRQTPLGSTLTDNQGRTLYLFAGDKPNASTLSRGRPGGLAAVHVRLEAGGDWSQLAHQPAELVGQERQRARRDERHQGEPVLRAVGCRGGDAASTRGRVRPGRCRSRPSR